MKYKSRKLRVWPRLLLEKSAVLPGREVGFLQLSGPGEKIEIGGSESREFRLIQCLFSPNNFLSAKYEPVVQTHERVFKAIRMSADDSNARLADRESMESEMSVIVERSVRNLQKGGAGVHLAFVSEGGKVRMEIIPANRAV
jgi:hypothetical protein